jgi:hypothetical protein
MLNFLFFKYLFIEDKKTTTTLSSNLVDMKGAKIDYNYSYTSRIENSIRRVWREIFS